MTKRILFRVILVLCLIGVTVPVYAAVQTQPPGSTGQTYFVAPNGLATNPGTIDAPWDITTAFANSRVVMPGDTVYLREGTYGTGGASMFTTTLNGTKEAPIIIRNYNNEHATIDGGITVTGKHNWLWGFEIKNSLIERNLTSEERVGGVGLYGEGSKVINMVIHDTGHPGIGFWRTVGDSGEIYGTLIWGVGVYDPKYDGQERGSPIYAQNEVGQRLIQDNITFKNFTSAMKAYATNSYANGFTFDGNTTFQVQGSLGLFIDDVHNPIDKTIVTNNYMYQGDDRPFNAFTAGGTGDTDFNQGQLVFKNNYIGTQNGLGISITRWNDVTSTNNTVVATKGSAMRINLTPGAQHNIDYNTYIVGGNRPFQDTELQSRLDAKWANGPCKIVTSTQTIEEYKIGRHFTKPNASCPGEEIGSRHDKNSLITNDLSLATNKVFVRPNKYEAGRANVTVYNWEKKENVEVDLTGVVKVGDQYKILDSQNFYGAPLATGTYRGGTISVPMTTTEHSRLIGNVTNIVDEHTSPEFGSFVVMPGSPGEPETTVASTVPISTIPHTSGPQPTVPQTTTHPTASTSATTIPHPSVPGTTVPPVEGTPPPVPTKWTLWFEAIVRAFSSWGFLK